MHARAAWLLDASLAAGAAVALFIPHALTDPSDLHGAGWLVGLAATVPLAWRRRAPLPVLAIISVAHVLAPFAGLHDTGYALLTVAVALYTAAGLALTRPWVRTPGAVAVVAVAATQLRVEGPWMAAWTATALAAGWLAGEVVAARRAYLEELEDKTRWLEVSREQEVQLAAAEERARIARELHDIVGHAVSLIAVRAGVGAHLASRDPAEAAEALRVIEQVSREALDDLRRALGILDDDRTERSVPQSLDAVPALCERITRAGTRVDVRVEGEPRHLPAALQFDAYRIIQEALTNSLKHASGAQVNVTVAYLDDALRLEVIDAGPDTSDRQAGWAEGRGLHGIGARAQLSGGHVEVGPLPQGGFRVAATWPVSDQPQLANDMP